MRRVVVLIAGSAGVQSLVGGALHVLNGEGSIVNALSHVGGQPHIILLPDDRVDRVARDGTLDEQHFPSNGRYSAHRTDVGHAWILDDDKGRSGWGSVT